MLGAIHLLTQVIHYKYICLLQLPKNVETLKIKCQVCLAWTNANSCSLPCYLFSSLLYNISTVLYKEDMKILQPNSIFNRVSQINTFHI